MIFHQPDEFAIQSIGPPPERHADRVIAAMLRDLAKSQADVPVAVNAALAASKNGGERAQQRMAERIRQAVPFTSA